MIKKLRLANFKNFREAELNLGPLTLLVGTNASGKSNLRDAFRFLHGISRGYSLAEIIGTKYGEGGELQWRGIRGGTREIAYAGESTFGLGVVIQDEQQDAPIYEYQISVALDHVKRVPIILAEALYQDQRELYNYRPMEFTTPYAQDPPVFLELDESGVVTTDLSMDSPILSQITGRTSLDKIDRNASLFAAREVIAALNSMRFLDLNPDAMRQLSFPGQTVLGDRGENLSSVLQAIYQDKRGKQTLLSWLRELTPMDASDFEFPPDQIGRILATLVERGGQKTSAYSASDGTLRFLAMIAALLGPETARLYFFEELDNGIHPTRLHLLLQLIEQQVRKGRIQVVATTHSPPMLRLLSPESLENVSVLYRAPDRPAAQIVRLLDLPDARRLAQEQDVASLFESGWLEDAIAFRDAEEIEA